MPRQAPGAFITIDPDVNSGQEVHEDTFMCCHCNRIITTKMGSGRVRGYCSLCNDVTCGLMKADQTGCGQRCAPWEEQMERAENVHRLHQRMING